MKDPQTTYRPFKPFQS